MTTTLPCILCGGVAGVAIAGRDRRCHCLGCGTAGPWQRGEDAAVDAWNRLMRPAQAPAPNAPTELRNHG